MAIPRGSSITPSESDIEFESGTKQRLGQAICSRRAPSCSPCPAKISLSHRLGSPRLQISQTPQAMDGSTATRSPSLVRAVNLCPSTSGFSRRASPIPASLNQCRSEPQIPTAVTRNNFSPAPGTGTGSSCRRTSPGAWRRRDFIVGIISLSIYLTHGNFHSRWLETPRQVVVHIIPLEFVLEFRQVGIVVNNQEFQASNLSEVFEVLGGNGLTEASVVSPTSQDPAICCNLEIGARNPYCTGNWQFRERFLWLDDIHLVHDHTD